MRAPDAGNRARQAAIHFGTISAMNPPPACRLVLTALALLFTSGFTTAADTPHRRWIVVSDIDDTIKNTGVVSDVPARSGTGAHPLRYGHLAGSFFGSLFHHPDAVPGMAARYQMWKKQHQAEFIYLSKSPLLLHHSLTNFLQREGFPDGPILLNPQCPLPSPLYKDAALRRILRAEPDAAFVFVGDSGEGDVETYGRIAGEFPRAVRRVFIREVTPLNDPPLRYTRAFAGVSGTCWDCRANLFTDAAQLPATLDPSATLPARHVQTAQAHRR